jgi:hypothetical protein
VQKMMMDAPSYENDEDGKTETALPKNEKVKKYENFLNNL